MTLTRIAKVAEVVNEEAIGVGAWEKHIPWAEKAAALGMTLTGGARRACSNRACNALLRR
jgi:hypothetical protein